MTETNIDDALQRLVHAMLGHDDPVATSLAHRVLTSQIGPKDDTGSWRRISRKAPQARANLESLYTRLEEPLAAKVLTVLTKLMGKKFVLPETAKENPQSSTPNVTSARPVSVPHTADARKPATSYQSFPQPHALQPKQPQATPPHDRQRQIQEEKQELEKEEALLLRECLYSLQGIDGERIRYYHKHKYDDSLVYYDGIRVQSPALSNALLYTGRVLETKLGTGATDAFRICGEAGWLYHRIQSYIQQVQQDESKGIVARAFAGTLGEELREYHSLLTQYESQITQLSLRQLLVDLRMPTSRLQVLALLTDGLRQLSGGHLLSGLYQHTLHGDSRHALLTQSILVQASRPWFEILFTWTTQGVLSDPHGEFFIVENPTVDDKHLWNEKYRINSDQIPEGILDSTLVGPVFNVGKGINFIRRCLLDGKWTMRLDNIDDDEDTIHSSANTYQQDLGFFYKPNADGNIALQQTLTYAAKIVHTHILRTLREDNHMMQHFFALKQFLLLGQGDFFSALMDGLHSEFRHQPGIIGIYKHSLLSIVEGALRSTNAKYLPQYVLDRLQVELLLDPDDETHGMFGPNTLSQTTTDQRTVWDIFMLDYQVPDPLRAIVHPRQLDRYKMVFSLLFNLKRIEFMLNFTWRQSATLQHALQTYGHYNGIHVQNSPGYAQAFAMLRIISILRQNMMHLIVNLKSYFMFEVLEGGWRRLQSEIEAAKTLDEVIAAHDYYMDGIVKKSLLRTGEKDDIIQKRLADHLQMIVQISGQFCEFQERLFHESLVMSDTASQKRIEADQRANQGRWGFYSEKDIAEEENFFGLADKFKMLEVERISAAYNHNVLQLLRVLNERVNAHPDDLDAENEVVDIHDPEHYGMGLRRHQRMVVDDDMESQRFLIAQLDHNNFYGAQGYLR